MDSSCSNKRRTARYEPKRIQGTQYQSKKCLDTATQECVFIKKIDDNPNSDEVAEEFKLGKRKFYEDGNFEKKYKSSENAYKVKLIQLKDKDTGQMEYFSLYHDNILPDLVRARENVPVVGESDTDEDALELEAAELRNSLNAALFLN